ncbi:MAG: hypothetical protein HY509_05865 [Acidobacteria bacterium]|nr:hypothetical protein [Acidobacteriota bacterium]
MADPRSRWAGRGGLGLPAALAALPLLLVLGACGAAPPESVRGAAGDWAGAPIWDDGRAEISAYEATAVRYGATRPFTAYLIVVKEDFSRADLVKADPGHDPADLFPVLKLNQVIRFQTGVYDYHQMLSVFFDRADLIPVKLSLAHFEWCGNSYKELRRQGETALLQAHTYWDGMAEKKFPLRFTGHTLLYDELPVWLRSVPPPEAERNWGVSLIPTQVSSRAEDPAPRRATLKFFPGVEEVPVRSEVLPASRVVLEWEKGTDIYLFHRNPPHVLLSWDRSDGGRYRLLWSRRMPYWELNSPGDEVNLQVAVPPAVDHS